MPPIEPPTIGTSTPTTIQPIMKVETLSPPPIQTTQPIARPPILIPSSVSVQTPSIIPSTGVTIPTQPIVRLPNQTTQPLARPPIIIPSSVSVQTPYVKPTIPTQPPNQTTQPIVRPPTIPSSVSVQTPSIKPSTGVTIPTQPIVRPPIIPSSVSVQTPYVKPTLPTQSISRPPMQITQPIVRPPIIPLSVSVQTPSIIPSTGVTIPTQTIVRPPTIPSSVSVQTPQINRSSLETATQLSIPIYETRYQICSWNIGQKNNPQTVEGIKLILTSPQYREAMIALNESDVIFFQEIGSKQGVNLLMEHFSNHSIRDYANIRDNKFNLTLIRPKKLNFLNTAHVLSTTVFVPFCINYHSDRHGNSFDELVQIVAALHKSGTLIVAGDFNQDITERTRNSFVEFGLSYFELSDPMSTTSGESMIDFILTPSCFDLKDIDNIEITPLKGNHYLLKRVYNVDM